MLFDLSNRIKAVPPEFSRFLILHQPAFLKNQAGAKFRLVNQRIPKGRSARRTNNQHGTQDKCSTY